MNVSLEDLVHYTEREIKDGRWFLEFCSWESSALTFPRFGTAMRLGSVVGGGGVGGQAACPAHTWHLPWREPRARFSSRVEHAPGL